MDLSDHSDGIVAPIVAISNGAKIIEKHITLNKNMEGPDHKASLEPKEFFNMVKNIRIAEVSLGSNDKKFLKVKRKILKLPRKSIVAKKNIFKGDKFSLSNLTEKRTGKGYGTFKIVKLLGKKSSRNYKKDEIVNIKKL